VRVTRGRKLSLLQSVESQTLKPVALVRYPTRLSRGDGGDQLREEDSDSSYCHVVHTSLLVYVCA
jgi:hypothetical protein